MSTPNGPTYEPEKPYKAEQDAAREELLDEIAEALAPPKVPQGAFRALDVARRWDVSVDTARRRLDRDERVEIIGKIGNFKYYRIKDD